MRTLLIALTLLLIPLTAGAAQFCVNVTPEQAAAAKVLRNNFNTDMTSRATPDNPFTPLTTKEYVTKRILSVFSSWVDSVNEQKAKRINLKRAYKESPDSVKAQIKTLLEPYK